MKFRVYHKNGKSKIITAKNLDEAEKVADKLWKNWEDIKILDFIKERKSPTLNKRHHVKESAKIYDRKKEKQNLKKQLGETDAS